MLTAISNTIPSVSLIRKNGVGILPGHHQAYIFWDDFEANQKQLCSNQINTELCGPAREGTALLPGLPICGKCGRRMTVRYTGTGGIRPLYECVGRWEHGNRATCSSVPVVPLDQAVSDKILSVMKPSELETSLKVMNSTNDADRMSDKQWLLAVERAQYEADRAERQFMIADPENRLVVRSLDANRDQKLKDLEKVKQDHAAYRSKKAWVPSKEEERDIMDLARRIPEFWNTPPLRIVHLLRFAYPMGAYGFTLFHCLNNSDVFRFCL